MLDLLLHPSFVLGALTAAAVLTPVAAWVALRRFRAPSPRRPIILAGAFGPFALVLWFLHNLVLETVGFDSIYSPMILAAIVAVVGFGAGRWSAAASQE